MHIRSLLVTFLVTATSSAVLAFDVGGDPSVVPEHFAITTFASGLDFPFGLTVLQDDSLLAGVNPSSGSYFAAQGALHRFVDADDDGVADGPGSILYSGLPGYVTSLRRAGDLVFVAIGGPSIVILRQGASPADTLVYEAAIDLQFTGPWLHSALSLAVRPQPGPTSFYELYFNIGSETNATDSGSNVTLTGLVSASAAPDSLYRVILDDSGLSLAASGLEQIASGLRNAFGADFDPQTGDLVLQDNGIDGSPDQNEPESADELNRIAAAEIGGAVEHFGFSGHYVQYRTGTVVGAGGIDPIIAFQPVPPPNGAEAEGAVDVVFAPPGFPNALRDGVFVGFHGRFQNVGLANEENPVVYADPTTGHYFHFVGNDEADLGHPNTLAATGDRLYLADMTNVTGLNSPGTGSIYRIRYAPPAPVPGLSPPAALVGLILLALAGVIALRRRQATVQG